jgi:hypothetical protein
VHAWLCRRPGELNYASIFDAIKDCDHDAIFGAIGQLGYQASIGCASPRNGTPACGAGRKSANMACGKSLALEGCSKMKIITFRRRGAAACAWLLAAVFAILFCSVQTAGAQELSPQRIKEIEGMLTKKPSGFGLPCSDRAAWADKSDELNDAIARAEQAIATPLPAFDPDAYLQFTKNGNRQPMERNLHSREGQLAPLVLAECAQYQGKFLPRIAEVLDSLAAMPSWTLSAHDPQLLNFHGKRYFVDLNAADMSDSMAEAMYLLGKKIPAATRAHVMQEMEKHVFGPMRASYLGGDVSAENHNGHWWLVADMNWNAVCLKGVTGAALAMLPSVKDRALFVAGAEHFIQHYEKGFAEDGYDTEGLGYWNYGFSHFIELRENLLRATDGKIDLLAGEKMQRVALFGLQFPMLPNNSAAFGDAGVMPRADGHLVAQIDHIFKLPPAEHAVPVGGARGTLTAAVLDLFPVRGDQLTSPAAEALGKPSLRTWYGDSGILVSRGAPGQDFAVTIKAGGNTTHSHNDIGSFAIGMGATQPVGEPGGPKFYTGATFGPHRLDSKLLNSFGHPVPEIGGSLQLDATKVKVSVTSHEFTDAADRITIDMTNAYDVSGLKQVTRTLVHRRAGNGSVEITDDFDLTQPTEIIESLPTHGTWKQVDAHTVMFGLDGEQVRATIDAPVPVTFTETKVDEYNNPFTRVEVHVPLAGSGKVSMRFTPVQ